MNATDVAQFWLTSAQRDRQTAIILYKSKQRHWCLYLWQLIIEKLLKALIVQINRDVPLTHNLVRLATQAKIKITKELEDQLKEITTFNLEARYDDYKFSFYKKATQNYTDYWVNICQRLAEKLEKKIEIKGK